MTSNSVSTVSLQLQTLRLMGQGQQSLSTLQEQLSTGVKTSDLSELGTTGARRLLDLRGSEDRRTTYQQVINVLQPRVKTQGYVLQNMTDLMTQIKSAINITGNATSASTSGLTQQVQDALRQVSSYLNENIDGRYLFSGARFTTKPVDDLTTLPSPPTEPYPFTPVTTATGLPSYDSNYAGPLAIDQTQVGSVTGVAATNSFTLGTGNWADFGYQVGDTVTFGGMSSAGNNATFTIQSIAGGTAVMAPSPAVVNQAADSTVTLTRAPGAGSTDAQARASDTVGIDDGLNVAYGLSSTDPAFQNMILGLRWAYAATQDPANFNTYIDRASSLLATASTQINGLAAANTANDALLTKTAASHTVLLNDLKTSVGQIQDVDRNEVAAKITMLQSQIEASYATTARITQLSLVNYL